MEHGLGLLVFHCCRYRNLGNRARVVSKSVQSHKDSQGPGSERQVVPWPLPQGVPHRAKILFCYWRAGYAFNVDEYPERVQSEFFDMLGSHLMRRDRHDESSSSD